MLQPAGVTMQMNPIRSDSILVGQQREDEEDGMGIVGDYGQTQSLGRPRLERLP